MLIALLAILGVDLIVIVVFAAAVLGRRRWLHRRPGQFTGAIRVASGTVEGLSPKWKRGCGRWVRDVLVWSKAPFLFRDTLIPVNRLSGQHQAPEGQLRRLGSTPAVLEFACDTGTIEIATKDEDRPLAAAAWQAPPA